MPLDVLKENLSPISIRPYNGMGVRTAKFPSMEEASLFIQQAMQITQKIDISNQKAFVCDDRGCWYYIGVN